MGIREDILKRLQEFKTLCISHKVKTLYAFGSSVSDRFDPHHSDIDLLVELEIQDPIERGEQLLDLWDAFETFFSRKIDLLTNASIKNPILRKQIDITKVLIYEGAGQKVLI